MDTAANADMQHAFQTPLPSHTVQRTDGCASSTRIGQYAKTDAVSNPHIAGSSTVDRLHGHLAPELHAQLAHEGALHPDIVRAECARLHAELTSITTYIPSIVVREQLAHPQPGRISGAYWDGTILFADLSGFTALSEKLSSLGKQGAEEVSAIINNLFGALVDEIHRYGGGLLKFGGDAITAFFGATALGAGHAALASRAALAMQERMAEFAALQTRAGVFRLRLRIGVHSGQVFAAQVGDAAHVEMVVTGRNINRVALAQEIAEPGDVVVSRATLALLAETVAEERQAGFHLLAAMPSVAPPPPIDRWGREHRTGDMGELLGLAERIDALRPYLPRGLPRRFLGAVTGEMGEFRPVTVLFANFFPFTTMLDILGEDVDTAARVLNAYYRRAQSIVHHYGGIVNKVDMYTYGDKLMALFGAPLAHEDDPVRATRAALDLQAALTQINDEILMLLPSAVTRLIAIDPQFIKQRIGINTGVVFAGQVGSARRHEYTVMGQHVNLAARLMSAAEEGAIVLSPATRRAVERHIALQELPPVKLKGIAEPVPLAQALRPLETTQDARRGLARAALVGRESELGRLIDEARVALNGSGRVVALVGEAGAGKTRLIEESLQRLVLLSADTGSGIPPFFPYSAECQSYEQNTPYAIIRDLLRQALNINLYMVAGMEAGEQASALAYRVQQMAPDMARFTPLLGDILGLPIEETPLTAALTPQQRHDRVLELVEALLIAETRRQPLVLILDDLHWADASSLDMLERLARQAPNAALLILIGYRLDPPIAEPWRELGHCARIEIRELSAESSAALVQALLRGDPPPHLAALIDRAQGNPFFIEEVVRGLVESGTLQRGPDGWQLIRSLDEAAVPDSIEGVITARLDRLEERAREVLQVASVIGRRFAYPVLSGVAPQIDSLADWLRRLADVDLILAEELERELAYLFKHALTRDVAYEAILYARRRDLHHRVARRIEELHADHLDDHLALLASHYLLAEEWTPAFGYHLRAGRQAQARYANREAITLYERALQIARQLTANNKGQELEAEAGDSQVADIYEQLGIVHALIGEYDTALGRYEAALGLLQLRRDPSADTLVRLHHHIARVYEKRAQFETAFEWVEQALTLAGATQSLELARCLLLGAGLHQRQGRYGQALEWGERALRIAEELGGLREQAEALMLLGGTYRNLGDNSRAFALTDRCLQIYEQAQELSRMADAHNNLANICYELGRLAEARVHYEAGAEIKQAIGDIYGQALIANNLGNLLKLQGYIDDAIGQYARGLAIFQRLGSLYATGVLHMNLGATYLLNGDLATAEEHLRRSAELYEQAGAEDFLPELERYLAELHLGRGDLARARLACELALTTAARLEARAEEGITRRTLGLVLIMDEDPAGAWAELDQSLAILRETSSPHEIARTLIVMAKLAPMLDRRAEGQAALDEALPALREIGAQYDIEQAQAIAARHGYRM